MRVRLSAFVWYSCHHVPWDVMTQRARRAARYEPAVTAGQRHSAAALMCYQLGHFGAVLCLESPSRARLRFAVPTRISEAGPCRHEIFERRAERVVVHWRPWLSALRLGFESLVRTASPSRRCRRLAAAAAENDAPALPLGSGGRHWAAAGREVSGACLGQTRAFGIVCMLSAAARGLELSRRPRAEAATLASSEPVRAISWRSVHSTARKCRRSDRLLFFS